MGLHDGSLALYGDGNIDNRVVVLFPSRDAKPDDVDDVSLHLCLECSCSRLTRATVQVGVCRGCSHLVHAQHRRSYMVSAITFLSDTPSYLQQCCYSCVVDLCKSFVSVVCRRSLLTSLIQWLTMPTNLVFLGTHFVIGKREFSSYVGGHALTTISTVYANSLLASLNTRQELRDLRSRNTKSTWPGNITFLSASGMRVGIPGNVRLLSFSLKDLLG